MKNFKIYFVLTVLGLSTISCSDDLLVENPPDILGAESLFVNKEGFEAGLAGLYKYVRQERAGLDNSSNDLTFEGAQSATDITFSLQTGTYGRLWNQWGVRNNPAEGYFNEVWQYLYRIMNASNFVIIYGERPDVNLTEEDKGRILGEAKVVRAWAYRHLTNLYGDVPLNLQASDGANVRTDWERTPVAVIRDTMEQDLIYAKNHLPETSDNDGKIVKGVAQHYLAELYLYKGEYQKAKDEATALINSGTFSLVTQRYGVAKDAPGTPFTDMFLDGNSLRSEGNTEVLWALENEFNVEGGEGTNIMRRWWIARYYNIERNGTKPIEVTLERGGRAIGRLGMTKFMFNLYDDESDDRNSNFAVRHFFTLNEDDNIPSGYAIGDTVQVNLGSRVESDDVKNPGEWPYTRKWESAPEENLNSSRQYDDQIFLRLGETYLILAEANFYLNDNQGAADAINVLRERAQASAVQASDINIDFILDERARELFSEENRRYALLRNNKWLERTREHNKAAGPNITERDKLFPVPQSVIDANLTKEMKQNPGY